MSFMDVNLFVPESLAKSQLATTRRASYIQTAIRLFSFVQVIPLDSDLVKDFTVIHGLSRVRNETSKRWGCLS